MWVSIFIGEHAGGAKCSKRVLYAGVKEAKNKHRSSPAWLHRPDTSHIVPNYCYTDLTWCISGVKACEWMCVGVIMSMQIWTSLCVYVCQRSSIHVWCVTCLLVCLHPSHLAFLVLVLVGVLALAFSPQLLQVWLGPLQRVLLHLVLHLVPLKCGLEQRKDPSECWMHYCQNHQAA